MSYLIDGSNLGGVGGGRRGARSPRAVIEWLLPWVRARSAGRGAERGTVIAVFDGVAPADVALRYGALEVEFAAPRSADDAILARVRAHPRRFIVVTNDAALARAARELGAEVRSASDLAQNALVEGAAEPRGASGVSRGARPRSGGAAGGVGAAAGDKPTPSGADQGYWKRVFGGEDPEGDS